MTLLADVMLNDEQQKEADSLALGDRSRVIAGLILERDASRHHARDLVETAGATNALALAEVRRLTQREKSLLEYNTEQVEAIRHAREGFEASERLRRDLEKRHVQLLAQRQADVKALLTDGWLIYYRPQRLYWKANAAGYTNDVTQAGRYSFQDAMSKAWGRDPLEDGTASDVVVPAPEFMQLLARIHGADLDPVPWPPPYERSSTRPTVPPGFGEWPRDRCQFCRGTKGNVRGNENVEPGGITACDDCSVLAMAIIKAVQEQERGARDRDVFELTTTNDAREEKREKLLRQQTDLATAQAAELRKIRKLYAKLRGAVLWALGERGNFPAPPEVRPGKPRPWYYWRGELRKRAGL